MIKKTIVQYVILSALFNSSMGSIAAVYVTFLTSHGLNLFEVNMVNLVFFFTMFVCEIPTGAFADIFGRKTSFVIACFLLSAGTFMYSWSTSFWQFALSEFIAGVGVTFSSGAFQAWLVDKLKHHGYQGTLDKVFSKASFLGKGIGVCSALLCAHLADTNPNFPWMLSGTSFAVSGLVAMFWLKEEYFVKKAFSFKLGILSMKETVQMSVKFGINNKVVRFILVVGIIQVFAVQAANMQWQPYFIQYVHEKTNLGYVWVGMVVSLMTGTLIAPRLLVWIKDEKKCLVICQIWAGIGIALTTLVPFPFNLIVFMLHEIPRGMYEPLKSRYLQDNIPSHARATISSFESVSPHLGGMIGLFSSGFIANRFGITTAWVISGLLMVTMTLLVARRVSAAGIVKE